MKWVRVRFYLRKALKNRDSCPSLVHLCQSISSAYIGVIMQLVVQIPRMDMILMGYWMAGQVRTMTSSVMYKSKLRMKNP